MCDHPAGSSTHLLFGQPCEIDKPGVVKGSRRRRLWDLPHVCYRPVVGVCLLLDTLRRRFNKALGLQAVADAWAQAPRQGEVAGTLWAAWTHPRRDTVLEEVLLHDMHLLPHQAGACVRVDIAKYNALMHENGVLARELGRVQERSTRLIAEKAGEVERLNALLVQARAESMGLRQKLAATTKSLEAPAGEAAHAAGAALTEWESPAAPVSVGLQQKKVLCVGGRTGSLDSYRDVVERVGGQFAHHDGVLEDRQNILDASLIAADLVICQTGCISHNAYWKVKDFCKRSGKRCIFVENPSASFLARGLEQISGKGSADATPAGHTGAGFGDGVQVSANAI